MADNDFQVATFEDRPFFEKALRFGFQQGIITDEKIKSIEVEAPKGMVQIATVFGSAYLRPEIELARVRIVNLASLYLSETAQGDLETAARLIRDNTFLTLSRGGSTLLKELFALPEYPILGSYDHGRVENFLEFWSRKKSDKDYQKTKKQREQYQLEIRLAKKLSKTLGLPESIFQEQHGDADSLIRSALLMGLQKMSPKKRLEEIPHCFDQTEFATILDTMRKKGVAKTVTLHVELNEEEQRLIAQLQQDIVVHDLPKIADEQIPLANLISQIKNRYFIRDHDMHDNASYDALVSKEWSKYTKGKNDIDAIFTLLLCIAANVPAKTSLSETAAKSLVKKSRLGGFFPELATEFIEQHAPHEKQQSLLEDWEDFCEQAKIYLLNDWDHGFSGALNFLRENCYIEKSGRSAAGTSNTSKVRGS